MPRPLQINEEIVPDAGRCELCGATLSDAGADREEHTDAEIIRRLSILADDDWKAAIILLLYVANPNATIAVITGKVRLERTEVCEARYRAAAAFPDLEPILALRTPRALAQQARHRKGTAQTEHQATLI